MRSLIVVLVLALLGAAVADLPANDLDQLETPDESVSDAARTEEINSIPTEDIDPAQRERADVYSTAAHLTNHISFGGETVHSAASPYASLFQVQEMDSRRLAEKDMALDSMSVVPEERDDSQAPVIPFYASADMTEIADPLLDVASEHHVDEEEDQALDHAADVLAEDVEAGDVAELAMSAPSLVEEEELPSVMAHDDEEHDDATFIEMMDDDDELAEQDDAEAVDEEDDDESDDEHDDESHDEEDAVHTEEHDDSFDDHSAEADAPAAEAEAPAAAATADQADDSAAKTAAEAPAAVASAPVPAGVATPTSDVTDTVQDQ